MSDTFLAGLAPTHPGEVLREDILPATGKTVAQLSYAMDLPELADILAERAPVTLDAARKIGTYFNVSPEMWLGLQASYDEAATSRS